MHLRGANLASRLVSRRCEIRWPAHRGDRLRLHLVISYTGEIRRPEMQRVLEAQTPCRGSYPYTLDSLARSRTHLQGADSMSRLVWGRCEIRWPAHRGDRLRLHLVISHTGEIRRAEVERTFEARTASRGSYPYTPDSPARNGTRPRGTSFMSRLVSVHARFAGPKLKAPSRRELHHQLLYPHMPLR